ncbi:AAA family ATPase [Thiomonas sp. FB-Cd]|uniref:AAA family ATPase n=1 Tax=Thiomonas sp. FB-Cd TaxID=1158292 RepID=UPI000A5C92BF|nr:AAA family ATPase [Thiomonas sp. FB-Cd]
MKRCLFSTAKNLPPLDHVLPGLLAGTVGLLVGQGAIGKTFLVMQIAISTVLGRAIAASSGLHAGDGGSVLWPAPKPGPVLLILGEDIHDVVQHRQAALKNGLQLTDEEIEILDSELEILSATELGDDMRLVQKDPAGNIQRGPFFDALLELCRQRRLVILDPLALLIAGVNENDNGQMTQFMRVLTSIAAETGCAILLPHHVGKTGAGGGEDWERSRGASALTTSVRLQLNLGPPSKDDMGQLGISPDEAGYWVRVAQVKANYAAPKPHVWLRRGPGGVLAAYEPFSSSPEPAVANANTNSYAAAKDGLRPASAVIALERKKGGKKNGPF